MEGRIMRMIDDKLFIEKFIRERAPWDAGLGDAAQLGQLRALFTNWCLRYDIDADTENAADMLDRMYSLMELEDGADLENLNRFFLAYIR